MVVAAAGRAPGGAMAIATTSKMSVGAAAHVGLKPPAVLVYRGEAGEAPEVFPGARLRQPELEAWLVERTRLRFPALHRDNFAEVCGAGAWCALAALPDPRRVDADAGRALAAAAAAAQDAVEGARVFVGALRVAEQPRAATFFGAAAGDVVLLQRPAHGVAQVGAGQVARALGRERSPLPRARGRGGG
jgi:hypothetical protein